MKKRKLSSSRCARSSYYLAIKLSPVRALKSTYNLCSTPKAKPRMYAILLFIYSWE
jgi:hypothetical protein